MIRPFDITEMREYLRLCKDLHSEGSVSSLKLSPQKLMLSLSRPDLFHEMAWEGEVAVGMCVGWVEDTFFGPDLVAHQHLFYVSPSHRGGMIGKHLMKRFESWALSQQAKEIWVSQATSIQIDRTRSLFEALGFTTVGFIARKVIQ